MRPVVAACLGIVAIGFRVRVAPRLVVHMIMMIRVSVFLWAAAVATHHGNPRIQCVAMNVPVAFALVLAALVVAVVVVTVARVAEIAFVLRRVVVSRVPVVVAATIIAVVATHVRRHLGVLTQIVEAGFAEKLGMVELLHRHELVAYGRGKQAVAKLQLPVRQALHLV